MNTKKGHPEMADVQTITSSEGRNEMLKKSFDSDASLLVLELKLGQGMR